MSLWDNIIAPFTGTPMKEAGAELSAGILQGQKDLEAQYANARGAVTNQYTQALQPYLALTQPATGGYQAYADASGANGLEGQIRAQQSFLTDPGYQFAQRQMEDAVQRAGVAGGVAIGNRTADIMDRTQGLASRAYGDYVSRLAPWLGQGLGIAGGLGNIYMGLGGELGRWFTGQGDAAARAQQAAAQARAQGLMAPMVAGSNIWNTAFNAANTVANFMGGKAQMTPISGGTSFATNPQYAGVAGNQYAGPVNPLLT